MRVLLVANYPADRQESMLRFAEMMRQGLHSKGHEVRVIKPPVVLGSTGGAAGKWLGYLDKFAIFPRQLRKAVLWADIVHICDHSNAMYCSPNFNKPVVVTCHDMLAIRGALGEPTDCPASWSGRILQRWITRGLQRADTVAAVSSATSDDVRRIAQLANGRVKTVLNALNYPYQPLPSPTELLKECLPGLDVRKPFVLHVGSNLRRKNKQVVIQSFAKAVQRCDLQLVLAGPPLTRELKELVRANGVEDRTFVAVKPENKVLQALYSAALCLFFPSRFEGFGWPLIEAQACGCAVLCSRCAPFYEVVGDGALMCDADDVDGFAHDLVVLATSQQERTRLRELGLQNVSRFAPEKMIDHYVEIYERLLSK